MKISKRRAHLLVICAIALCIIIVVPLLLFRPLPDVTPAITKAIPVFEGSGEPYALLFLDIIYRRFGIEEFSDALQRYDQILAENPDNSPLYRLFRRIADHDNPLNETDLLAVTSPLDQITIPALYCDLNCDLMKLDSSYLAILEKAVSNQAYLATHVLLAWIWIQENGCNFTLPQDFAETVYNANAALIDVEDETVYDIELEAAAFLCLAGKANLIKDGFAEQVLESQNPDGSWGYSIDNWHTTVLGLLYLLHLEYPSDSYPPSLASASP
jgi:hypothetical protein